MKNLFIAVTCAIIGVFVAYAMLSYLSDRNCAQALYQAKCDGDSVSFVDLYSYANNRVIRKYERLVKDSIAEEREYISEINKAKKAWRE